MRPIGRISGRHNWRDARLDELGNAARFSVDEKLRPDAYREMTKIFLENVQRMARAGPVSRSGKQTMLT